MATAKAGSLEPISGGKGKWHNEIDAAGIGELSALARDIDKAVDNAVKQVARGKIKVGKLLLEARGLFTNDLDFGKWRVENTMIQSKQHAHYLMQVADRFGDAVKLIDGANYSVMQELVLADQSDIEWVEAKIEEGDPPTVTEVRSKVKETQAQRLQGTSKKGVVQKSTPIVTPHAKINTLVGLSLTLRIQEVKNRAIKGIEGDLIILGMDPDPQIPCHPECLIAIVECWEARAESADEKRAIVDSARRVEEEFDAW